MKTRVLMIEDDTFKAEDLGREISEGHEVTVVASVRDAVVTVLRDAFDVVVLDMALPTFTADAASASGSAQPQGGVEVLRALRTAGRDTPVIIVSQYPDLEVEGKFHALAEAPKVLSDRYDIRVVGAVIYDFRDRAWAHAFQSLLESTRQE